MKVDQSNITNPYTVPVYPQPPSNIPNVEYFPSGSSICQITEASKPFRMEMLCIRKLSRMDQRSRIPYPHPCQMSLTLQTWNLPPPDRPSDELSGTATV